MIEQLRAREMVQDLTEGIQGHLGLHRSAGYVGIDPTAPSLHVGNLAPLMLLRHLQNAGHRPVILLGGATAMIGDPSGKAKERKLLDWEAIRHNQDRITLQIQKLFDTSATGGQEALLLNNLDWFAQCNVLEFVRNVGKHISVGYINAKETVKRRIAQGGSGMSFTEYTYPLLQAYDFYHLCTTYDVRLQMGGSDQWGNLTTGLELIGKKQAGPAFALTTPLITKPDGTKFGKTEAGTVWLDPNLTSPYAFYQFWLNCNDELAHTLLKRLTMLSLEEIQDCYKAHFADPSQRILQRKLARQVTRWVHSRAALDRAEQISDVLFGTSAHGDLNTFPEKELIDALSGIPVVEIQRPAWKNFRSVIDVVVDAHGIICQSRSQARRLIQEGGLWINKQKIDTPQDQMPELLHNAYLLIQKGRKRHFLVHVQ